jgi:serine protease
MGYGLINVTAAVEQAVAQCTTVNLDLFMKNRYDDFGFEPDLGTSGLIYESPDIWVRNQPDGHIKREHQNAEYGQTNYVYVRVRNRSCVESDGTEELHLYWSKASVYMAWPLHWNGNHYLDGNSALAGEQISYDYIPPIPPGETVIMEFAWDPPSPDLYDEVTPDEAWHFCLLARIVSQADPMATEEGVSIAYNVSNNNNIVWKNLTIVDNMEGKPGNEEACPTDIMSNTGYAVAIGTPFDEPGTFDLNFSVPMIEERSPIVEEAMVLLSLDEDLYQKWLSGGSGIVRCATY